MRISFLFLQAYSSIGGIQKFNKNFILSLDEIGAEKNITIHCLSLSDHQKDFPVLKNIQFWSARGNKLLFLWYSVFHALRSQKIIVGHLNLAFPLMFIVAGVSALFKTQTLLVTHGIEAWKINSKFKKKSLQYFDSILTVSNYTKKKILDTNQLNESRIKIFPNTLDPTLLLSPLDKKPEYLLSRYKLHQEDKILLTLCRIAITEKEKGYENVIYSLKEAIITLPELKYVLAGPLQEEEHLRLTAIIEQLQLSQHIIFTGKMIDNELNDLINMCDLFIMPSKKEGFGIVFLEALACGKPVIAGNMDGSVDALLHGELGLLIDPESINEITNAILSYFNQQWPIHLYEQKKLRDKALKQFGFFNFKERLKKYLFD